MSFPSEKKLPSEYHSQIERNKQFASDMATNLPFYQKGLLSSKELLRIMLIDPSNAEAYVITPTVDQEFPLTNCLWVRRYKPDRESPPQIEVHDPFMDLNGHEYTSVVLGVKDNLLYPARVFRNHDQQGRLKEMDQSRNEDKGEGEAIVSFFEIARVLE